MAPAASRSDRPLIEKAEIDLDALLVKPAVLYQRLYEDAQAQRLSPEERTIYWTVGHDLNQPLARMITMIPRERNLSNLEARLIRRLRKARDGSNFEEMAGILHTLAVSLKGSGQDELRKAMLLYAVYVHGLITGRSMPAVFTLSQLDPWISFHFSGRKVFRSGDALVQLPVVDLMRILKNLTGNAHNAFSKSSCGSVVSLEFSSEEREGAGELTTAVRDNGPGISERNFTRMFDLYFTTSSDSKQLHGLGLSIVRELVDRLGGDLEVESVLRARKYRMRMNRDGSFVKELIPEEERDRVQRGTSFFIRLPFEIPLDCHGAGEGLPLDYGF